MSKANLFTYADNNGRNIEVIAVILNLDDFDEYMYSDKEYELFWGDEKSLLIKIPASDLKKYVEFYSESIAESIADGQVEIPFFINITDDFVIDPKEAYFKFTELVVQSEELLRFETLIFAMPNGKKEVGIMQMKFSFMNELLSPKRFMEFEDFPFITVEKLKSLYLDFLEKKTTQKYFLLAIDINEEKAIGYIIEPSINCSIDKIRLIIHDN